MNEPSESSEPSESKSSKSSEPGSSRDPRTSRHPAAAPLPPSYLVHPYPAQPQQASAHAAHAHAVAAASAAAAAASGTAAPPSVSRKLLQRVGTVAGLVLLLLIPLQLIRSTIAERTSYRADAVRRVVTNTTAAQQLTGPLLVMPWTDAIESSVPDGAGGFTKSSRRVDGHALRAPTRLAITGPMIPSLLKVGLYEVSVYEWRASLKASFAGELPLPAEGTRTWGAPYLVFGIADVRGLVGTPQLKVDGVPIALGSGTRALGEKLTGGVHAMLPAPTGPSAIGVPGETPHALPITEVAFDFALKGTRALGIVPVGDDTRVELDSSWPHPKFDGYSPRSQISDAGFKAVWELSALASNVRAQLIGDAAVRTGEAAAPSPGASLEKSVDPTQIDDLAATRIGSADALQVSLVDPVDVYTQTDRASKYGILFVVLTFVGFVAFELIKRLPIHPLQYLLVGLALAVFFLLLLSLSEHLAFWRAYVISAAGCIGLQLAYLSGVLKSWLRASGFAVMLTALYGVLYSLLASEDNALLMGSLLLFSVLAAVMWATRKIDWYELGEQLR
jgi:inner membrane protein